MKIKNKYILVLVILASFLASYLYSGVGDNPRVQNSITFVGILFGIIVGFFITDLYVRYQSIRNNAGTDSSCPAFHKFLK